MNHSFLEQFVKISRHDDDLEDVDRDRERFVRGGVMLVPDCKVQGNPPGPVHDTRQMNLEVDATQMNPTSTQKQSLKLDSRATESSSTAYIICSSSIPRQHHSVSDGALRHAHISRRKEGLLHLTVAFQQSGPQCFLGVQIEATRTPHLRREEFRIPDRLTKRAIMIEVADVPLCASLPREDTTPPRGSPQAHDHWTISPWCWKRSNNRNSIPGLCSSRSS